MAVYIPPPDPVPGPSGGGPPPPPPPGAPPEQPTPGGPPTSGNLANFEWFYQNVIKAHPEWFDESISKDQWQAWEPLRDKSINGPNPYRSESRDANGNPIGGLFNKPVDCPDGTTKYGEAECLPPDHPKVMGVRPGGAQQTTGQTEPPRPATLQDLLMAMFEGRQQLFGFKGGREPNAKPFAGQFGVDQYGNPLPNAPDLVGKALSGGGLVWGDKGLDLSQFGGTSLQPSSSPLGSVLAPPPSGQTPPPTDVLGGSVTPPVVAPLFSHIQQPMNGVDQSPLASLLTPNAPKKKRGLADVLSTPMGG